MNKKSILVNILVLSMACGAASAQDSTRVSLQKAIEISLKNRKEISIEKISAEHSDNEVRNSASKLLPQLSGDFDMRYNGKLPTSVIPGEAFGTPGSPSRRVQLGAGYSTLASLNLNIPVFSPSELADKKIARVQASYDRMNIQKAETDVRAEVIQSYFGVLINKERLKLSKTNLERSAAVLTMAMDQNQKGVITGYDLEKSRIDSDNAKTENAKNANNYRLSLSELAYRMGLDSLGKLVISDELADIYARYRDILSQAPVLDRVELKMQKVQQDLYSENIKKQNKAYLPTISLYGNYSVQNLNDKFSLFKSNNWEPYNYVGIKATISIFDGFAKQRAKNGYQLQLQSARMSWEKLKADYDYEIKKTRSALFNDQKDLENQVNNLHQAEELYRIDADRYHKGTIRQTDLSATFYTLQQTQVNYMNAVYTFLVDVVQYKKSTGEL